MKKLAMLFGAAVSLALAGPALAQSPIVIKFSHVVAPNTPKGKGSEKFKELAEKYTSGKVKVEVYPNSQLYKDKESSRRCSSARCRCWRRRSPSSARSASRNSRCSICPTSFPDKAALRKVTDGALGKKLFGLLEPKGITGPRLLGQRLQGHERQQAAAHAGGLPRPEDAHPVLQGAGGADARARRDPQVMAFSEVYQALQTGVVDGTENPPSNEYTQKMHEVQKYTVHSGHGYIGYAVITNKKFWDGLPADIRASLEKAMAEATEFANGVAQQDNDEAVEAMRKSGKTEMVELTAEQKAAWHKVLDPVATEMESRVGKETIAEFRKETGVATQ